MKRRRNEQFEFESIQLKAESTTPVYQQLESQLRQAISTRTLLPGDRLPSSRNLATAIGVSRNTVLAAYGQLNSEGYLEAAHGSGTRVAKMLPHAFEFDSAAPPAASPLKLADSLSAVGRQFSVEAEWLPTTTMTPKAFTPHLPAIDEFPLEVWNRFHKE